VNRRKGTGVQAWHHRLLGSVITLLVVLAAPAGAVAASKWTVRQLPPQPVAGGPSTDQVVLYAVSCPSDSLCVAVGALDTVAFSQTPTGGAERWHASPPCSASPAATSSPRPTRSVERPSP